MGKGGEEDYTYDKQQNLLASLGICAAVTILGIIIGVVVLFTVDGAAGNLSSAVCGTDFVLLNNLCERVGVAKSVCPKGSWGKDCLPCLTCHRGSCDGSGTQEGDGTCMCMAGYAGERCDMCAPGFYGPACTKCSSCSGHGVCNGTGTMNGDGTCLCTEPFTGPSCSECLPGRYGSMCATLCSPKTCKHGHCDKTTGSCICKSGYAGVECDTCTDGFFSTKGGFCEKNFTIVCNEKHNGNPTFSSLTYYYGEECKLCPGVTAFYPHSPCSDSTGVSHGTCDHGFRGRGTCFCDDGYMGNNCTVNRTAYENGLVCSNGLACGVGGTCRSIGGNEKCVCHAGYTGTACDRCGRGFHKNGSNACIDTCASTAAVPKSTGFWGPKDKCKRCPGVNAAGTPPCHGKGVCSDSNGTCDCNVGFAGVDCAECAPDHFGLACTACPNCGLNGLCSAGKMGSGKCVCKAGYTGALCTTCAYGYVSDGGVCRPCPLHNGAPCNFPNGLCSAAGGSATCRCGSNYIGTACGGVDPTHACGGLCSKGTCTRGKCYCNKGYGGTFCNISTAAVCTADAECASCEYCSLESGTCMASGQCCGHGVFLNGACACVPEYSGSRCSDSVTGAKYRWTPGPFGRCSQACGPSPDSGRIKTRTVKCTEYKDNLPPRTVADPMCSGDQKPSVSETCNQFECGEEVGLVELTLDMDFDTVVASAKSEFAKALKEDLYMVLNVSSGVEVLSMKKGSVKAKISVVPVSKVSSVPNPVDVDKLYEINAQTQFLGRLTGVETTLVKSTAGTDSVFAYVQSSSAMKPSMEAPPAGAVSTGGGWALSIGIVFAFVGSITGAVVFRKKAAEAAEMLKRKATQATSSSGLVKIQLTKAEREVINPLQMGVQGKAENLLATAVATVQRAIQYDQQHDFEKALPMYRKANEQFLQAMKSEMNQDARFALAKRVDGYVKREQYLNSMVANAHSR